MWRFLKLLKVPRDRRNVGARSEKEILAHEQEKEVRKAKKNSASSIFSNQTYVVCKYALGCDQMMMILVTFYNLLIKTGYYPKRWTKLVDTILEKGKGPILGKLKTITLIEGDLQIMMRMYLNAPEEELIKGDKRFSKANYSSRKNFSIETAILEK